MPLLLKVIVQDCHIDELQVQMAEVTTTLEKMQITVNDNLRKLENAFCKKKSMWELDHQIMGVTLEKFRQLEENCERIGRTNHTWIVNLQKKLDKLQMEFVEKKTNDKPTTNVVLEVGSDVSDIRAYFKDQNDTTENESEEAGDPPPAYSTQPALD